MRDRNANLVIDVLIRASIRSLPMRDRNQTDRAAIGTYRAYSEPTYEGSKREEVKADGSSEPHSEPTYEGSKRYLAQHATWLNNHSEPTYEGSKPL